MLQLYRRINNINKYKCLFLYNRNVLYKRISEKVKFKKNQYYLFEYLLLNACVM